MLGGAGAGDPGPKIPLHVESARSLHGPWLLPLGSSCTILDGCHCTR